MLYIYMYYIDDYFTSLPKFVWFTRHFDEPYPRTYRKEIMYIFISVRYSEVQKCMFTSTVYRLTFMVENIIF